MICYVAILGRRAKERTESHFTSRGLSLPSANENKEIVPFLESTLVAVSEKHTWRGKCVISAGRAAILYSQWVH